MLEYLSFMTSSVNLAIFAATLTVVYVINSWLRHPSDLPPMPCRPVPIIGHILQLKPSLRDAMMKWRKEIGDIFSFYAGSKYFVALSSYPLIHEAFVKQADKFSDRPVSIQSIIWPQYKHGISSNSGPSWKEQRTVSVSILRQFGMGKNWLAEKIIEEVEGYIKTLESAKGEARDLQLITNTAVSNVICAILLGKRFDYNDPFLTRFVKQNIEQLKLFARVGLASAFPWVRFLPGDKFNVKKLMENTWKLNKLFSEDFIKQFRDNADDTSTDNFIKAYLREMYKRAKSDPNNDLSETHLRRIIDILFLGGTDTTSTTILWAFAFAIHNPDYQKKIYQEILEEVGTERVPTIQDKPKLKYLNAFILESQRLGSIVPFGVNHRCSKTTRVGGYRIPEGAIILPYLDGLLKDEKVWKDAHTFRPERFLTKDGDVLIPKAFLPFSLGRRVCLGESLAKMELFLFLSVVFQRFDVLPESPDKLPQLVTSKHSPLGSLTPYRLRMKERTRL